MIGPDERILYLRCYFASVNAYVLMSVFVVELFQFCRSTPCTECVVM